MMPMRILMVNTGCTEETGGRHSQHGIARDQSIARDWLWTRCSPAWSPAARLWLCSGVRIHVVGPLGSDPQFRPAIDWSTGWYHNDLWVFLLFTVLVN